MRGIHMNIFYITQHYPPEIGAAQARAYDMSKNLAEKGHTVTVLTAFPNDKVAKRLFRVEKRSGVTVKRSFMIRDTKKSSIRRLLNYISFMMSSMISGLFMKKPDVIFATTPPLFVGVSGYVLSRIHRTKFVIEVRDLWVDFAEVLNQINNNFLLRAARKLEYFLYKRADKIITVTHGYKERLIFNGIPKDKIEVITNGVDPAELNSQNNVEPKKVKNEIGVSEDSFIILYAGNHGAAQGLHVVLDAAQRLKEYPKITFLFIGDGVEKQALVKRAKSEHLSNVIFLDAKKKEELNDYYQIADLCLVSLKKHPLFDITIPSKLFDCMAMGKPVLIGVNGEAKQIVAELNAGFHFLPEDSNSLVEQILYAYHHPSELEKIEKNIRSNMLEKYDRRLLSNKLEEILNQTVFHRTRLTKGDND